MPENPFADKFPDLRPGERPSLGSVNGFGTRLVGRRDYDPETGTYVATQVFCLLFVPVVSVAAYLVADAPGGGWYCVGRVPLSRTARRLNLAVLLAIVAGIGAVWWNSHTHSAEYLAARKLDEADKAAAAGEGGKAARLCKEVMDGRTSKAADATAKLTGFVAEPPGPPAEAAAVYAVAVDLHRENRSPVPDLYGRGSGLAARHADADPAAALALLEVVAPFAPNAEAELSLRRDLLERLLVKNPTDVETAGRLAVACEAKGDRDRCEKVLAPLEKQLGKTDGAAVLGRICAARGEYDRAYALLRPYVDARLPAYRTADQALRAQLEAFEKRVTESLKNGTAPGFDFQRIQNLPKAQQGEAVNAYFADQLKADAGVRAAQQRVMAERGVVGAAMDLGLVQLQRGQAAADPAARKAELEAAEKTFLSVRTAAGESDQYRLTLGQVYYWLGRQAEGRKLFDEVLAAQNRSAEVSLRVANTLREVGDNSGARQLAEEAYARETEPDKKQQVARFRALVFTDLDDEIAWLDRSNTTDPHTRASLATARGQKAVQDGKDDEAAEQFRAAIALFEGMPVNPSSLNNCALSHFALFRVTHDRADYTRGADKLDRAVALLPTDSILLNNAAETVLGGAVIDVVGDALDARVLRASGGWDALPYLYRTAAEQAAVYDRLRRHPGAVKARAYAEKLLTLAPKRDESYEMLARTHDRTRDAAALAALLVRLEGAELDLAEDARRSADLLSGKDDAKLVAEARKAVARAQTALTAARGRKDRTFAVAVGRYVNAKVAAWVLGEAADADELVKLADEAHAAVPSAGTEATLHTALLLRAHETLARTQPEYARLAAKTRRSVGTLLPYYVIATDGPLKTAAAADPDMKRIAALLLEDFKTDPDGSGPATALLVRAVQPDAAAAVIDRVKANDRLRTRARVYLLLHPYSASSALDGYWWSVLDGKPAEAKKILAGLAAKGVPVP